MVNKCLISVTDLIVAHLVCVDVQSGMWMCSYYTVILGIFCNLWHSSCLNLIYLR